MALVLTGERAVSTASEGRSDGDFLPAVAQPPILLPIALAHISALPPTSLLFAASPSKMLGAYLLPTLGGFLSVLPTLALKPSDHKRYRIAGDYRR